MKKVFFPLILGTVFLFPCFAQNVLILNGEYNFFKPEFWSIGAGFNMKLFNNYIQNDFLLGFGGIKAEEPETGGYPPKFLFSFQDSLYITRDWKYAGLRAGLFAALGNYGVPDYPANWDLFFSIGGFAGVSILPRSPVSVTVDLRPGYAIAFRTEEGGANINEAGFSLSPSVGIRFNFDKL